MEPTQGQGSQDRWYHQAQDTGEGAGTGQVQGLQNVSCGHTALAFFYIEAVLRICFISAKNSQNHSKYTQKNQPKSREYRMFKNYTFV